MRPFNEVMRQRGRPKSPVHKLPVTVRLDPEIVEYFKVEVASQFDPRLIEVFLESIDEFYALRTD